LDYEKFIAQCEKYDWEEAEGFAEIIVAALGMYESAKELAFEFRVAPPTVGRWVAKVSAPVPLARKAAVEHLIGVAREKQKKSRSKVVPKPTDIPRMEVKLEY